ncbi:HPr family phosphocarrier protein [Roseospirillum parvum]|uniref:Phosphocarrier protein n=1 Tax=Roseospirillum parvum TaxID=83401 RepID=A0A1G7ZZP1_9PROT|nr:HPr family phosphocarrier protein [Roseospirillum parvum]SDH14106.1 phosphocarrier protein [Roseospirillum parvum]
MSPDQPAADPAPDGALERSATIVNSRGLHARAAARFVKLAETFEAEVTVSNRGQEVSGRSIMGLMMLAASPGTTIGLSASGPDAKAALDALCKLIADRFHED